MRRQHMWSNSNALDPVRPPSASTSKSPSISERVETSRAGRVDNPHLPQRPQGGAGARAQVGAVSSESRHKRKAVERSEQAEAPAGRGRCPRMIAACQERQDDGRPLDSVRFELFAVLATSPNRRDILPILVSQNDRSPRSMEIGEISAIGDHRQNPRTQYRARPTRRHRGWVAGLVHPRDVTPMPEPGDVSPGFIAEACRSCRMVYDHNFQATHCAEPPAWTGRWRSPRGDGGGSCGSAPTISTGSRGCASSGDGKGRPSADWGSRQKHPSAEGAIRSGCSC